MCCLYTLNFRASHFRPLELLLYLLQLKDRQGAEGHVLLRLEKRKRNVGSHTVKGAYRTLDFDLARTFSSA